MRMSPENQNLPSPESLNPTEHYAVPFEAVDNDMWYDIIDIYFASAYKDREPDEDTYLMMPVEKAFQFAGYRIGSRFSPHSKLQPEFVRGTDGVTFSFHVNEQLSGAKAVEAEEAKTAFKRNIDAYLQKREDAIPYSTPAK